MKYEFFCCVERFGEWDEIGKYFEDVRIGEFKIEDLFCIFGEVLGGFSICIVFRVVFC